MPIVSLLLGAALAVFWIVFHLLFALGHMVIVMIARRRRARLAQKHSPDIRRS